MIKSFCFFFSLLLLSDAVQLLGRSFMIQMSVCVLFDVVLLILSVFFVAFF